MLPHTSEYIGTDFHKNTLKFEVTSNTSYYARVIIEDASVAYISWIFGPGWGAMLLEVILHELGKKGVTNLYVHATQVGQTPLQKIEEFYTKHGFVHDKDRSRNLGKKIMSRSI